MKPRTVFRITTLVLFVILTAAITLRLTGAISFGRLLSGIGITHTERTASSRIILERMRPLFRFNTVSYVYRTVFPYDYMDRDISLSEIMNVLRLGRGPVEEQLSRAELEYFQAYNLANELGLQKADGSYDFVVITVTVYAGFDVTGTPFASDSVPVNGTQDDWIQSEVISTANGGSERRATVRLPPAVVTEATVSDTGSADYGYPDVHIDPDGVRRISDFVRERVIERTVAAGLLEDATRNGERFFSRILHQAGYNSVHFVTNS